MPAAPATGPGSALAVGVDELLRLAGPARSLAYPGRRRASAVQSGQRSSLLRGRGMDYRESRPYQPGDEIRHMDWRVTARRGRAHTKLFQEERERPVLLVLDLRPAMFFGIRQRLKAAQAVRAAALVAWAAIAHGDRIGAVALGLDRHAEVAPAGGRRGLLRVLRALSAWSQPPEQPDYSRQQPLTPSLESLPPLLRPGSLAVLLSDFQHLGEGFERILSRLSAHAEVLAIALADPLEREPPPGGAFRISDGARSGWWRIGAAGDRHASRRRFLECREMLTGLLARRRIGLAEIDTDAAPEQALGRLFGRRGVGP